MDFNPNADYDRRTLYDHVRPFKWGPSSRPYIVVDPFNSIFLNLSRLQQVEVAVYLFKNFFALNETLLRAQDLVAIEDQRRSKKTVDTSMGDGIAEIQRFQLNVFPEWRYRWRWYCRHKINTALDIPTRLKPFVARYNLNYDCGRSAPDGKLLELSYIDTGVYMYNDQIPKRYILKTLRDNMEVIDQIEIFEDELKDVIEFMHLNGLFDNTGRSAVPDRVIWD